MQTFRFQRVPSVIAGLFVLDLFFACMYGLLVIARGRAATFSWLFDLNREASIPTWYSSMKLFLVALTLTLLALLKARRPGPGTWWLWLLPVVFFALSMDEVATLHEWINANLDKYVLPGGDRKNTLLFKETGVWLIVLPVPFLLFMAYLIHKLRPQFANCQRAFSLFGLSVLVYVGAACGSEFVYNFIPTGGVAALLQILVEEWGEMLGATLMLWAAWTMLEKQAAAHEPSDRTERMDTLLLHALVGELQGHG